MSIEATRWAYSQVTGSSARKAVLVNLADRCGNDNTCYPSISRIAKDTELNEKTVRKAIHDLCELGLIVWTGETKGLGAKVYKLVVQEGSTPTKFGSTNFNTPTNFTTTKNGSTPLPNLDVPPTNFGSTPLPNLGVKPINEPIMNISSEHTSEKNGTHTHEAHNFQNQNSEQNLVSEPSVRESPLQDNGNESFESRLDDQPTGNAKARKKSDEGIKPPVKAKDLIELGVSEQVAFDFLRGRKNQEITHTALVRNQNQAAKANLSLAEALQFAAEKGWQAFTADYYFNVTRSQNPKGNQHANHQSSYSANQQQPVSHFDQLRAAAQAKYGNSGQTIRTIQPVATDGH